MKIVTANGKQTLKMSKTEWLSIGKKAGWRVKSEKFIVIDNEFNRTNYPDLVGKIFDSPPSYAQVKPIEDKKTINFPKLPPMPPKGPERDAWKEQVVTELEQKVEELKAQGWTQEDFIREIGKMFAEESPEAPKV